MNTNMNILVVMAAIAIYKTTGVLDALAYLVKNAGCTIEEATDIIAMYDRFEDSSRAGLLH